MIHSNPAHVHFASLIAGVCGLLLAFMFGIMSYGVYQNSADGGVIYNVISGLLALASGATVRGSFFVFKLPNLH